MTISTRFAPSPTGLLHIGNIRTAVINWLYTRKQGGKFLLRIDNTDLERSKKEYEYQIKDDLKWLGLDWDDEKEQSGRLDRYSEAKEKLIADGRLYPCYETEDEIDVKRKRQLSQGKPPIYDRAALKLSDDEIKKFESEGRKAHWRFLLNDETTAWEDEIKGEIKFEGRNMSDPVIYRQDGTLTYLMASVVDDIDFEITNVIRGEDHVSNTAIQIQIFEALDAKPPVFAHLPLIKSKEEKISKRKGGFDIKAMRMDMIMPMAINSLLSKLGSSDNIVVEKNLADLTDNFDIKKYSKSSVFYDIEEIGRLNHKLLIESTFADIQEDLEAIEMSQVDEMFFLSVQANLENINDIKYWWKICKEEIQPQIIDSSFLDEALKYLPSGDWNEEIWQEWISILKKETGRKGKDLFMPIRLALTADEHGPELGKMLYLIGRDKAIKRLQGEVA